MLGKWVSQKVEMMVVEKVDWLVYLRAETTAALRERKKGYWTGLEKASASQLVTTWADSLV